MSIKTILSVALVLGLAACSKNQEPAQAPVQVPGPPPPKVTVLKPGEKPAIPGEDPRIKFSAFENIGACVADGWTQAQCDRAWGTSNSMAAIDAPKYATETECSNVWKFCKATAEKFSPSMVAFIIAGENRGDAPPSLENPSFYIPVFASSQGKFGYLTGSVDKPMIMEIAAAKISKAVQPQAAPSTKAPGSPQAPAAQRPAPPQAAPVAR